MELRPHHTPLALLGLVLVFMFGAGYGYLLCGAPVEPKIVDVPPHSTAADERAAEAAFFGVWGVSPTNAKGQRTRWKTPAHTVQLETTEGLVEVYIHEGNKVEVYSTHLKEIRVKWRAPNLIELEVMPTEEPNRG